MTRRAKQHLRAAVAILVWAFVVTWNRPSARADAAVLFSQQEVSRILAHGPWPPPWKPDPSNRASGSPDAIALGRLLFFDARLSGQGTHACSSCHRPEMAWTDGRAQAQGLATSQRNTPSLYNVRYMKWFGWAGAGDSLWAQSIRPILDPKEMGSSAAHVKAHIVDNPALAEAYGKIFRRGAAETEAEDVLVDAAKALAAFQETILSPATPFDAFRDALAANAEMALATYAPAAKRGLRLFVGKGGCAGCHAGPKFSDGTFQVANFGLDGQFQATGHVLDFARLSAIEALLESPYNLRGKYNDDPTRSTGWGPDVLPKRSQRFEGRYRVPPLRGVVATGPYLHDGRLPTLGAALSHSVASLPRSTSTPTPGTTRAVPTVLLPAEIADLVAFLESLSP